MTSDWARKFGELISEHNNLKYEVGVNDCVRFVCKVIDLKTSVDRWPEVRGYKTKREAIAVLARYGHSFIEAGDAFFKVDHQPTRFSRRGDVCAYKDAVGQYHLVVDSGDGTAVGMFEVGWIKIKLSKCACVWRID